MPNLNICCPTSSAPTDRMVLGVHWVRPGASAIDGATEPGYVLGSRGVCFEGDGE